MKGRDNLQGCGQDQGKPGRDDKVLLGVIITPRPEEAAVREGHLTGTVAFGRRSQPSCHNLGEGLLCWVFCLNLALDNLRLK